MSNSLYETVHECLKDYKQTINQTASNEDWTLVDVLLVGSIITDQFKHGSSDIDLCAILSLPPDSSYSSGVVHGFDAYLMEDRAEDILRTVDADPVEVDAGAYTKDTFPNISMIHTCTAPNSNKNSLSVMPNTDTIDTSSRNTHNEFGETSTRCNQLSTCKLTHRYVQTNRPRPAHTESLD